MSKKTNFFNMKTILPNFLISFLFLFMVMIFGPTEIFFGNIEEFTFLFQEFFWVMLLLFLICLIVLTMLLSLLPEKIRIIVQAFFSGISFAGYIQIMFLNRNLDLLGVNPEGYHVPPTQGLINLVIWLAIILALLVLSVLKPQIGKQAMVYGSAFLIAIQLVAMVSLVLTGPAEAFNREATETRLSGDEQYTVSARENTIVFILDYFSSYYLDQMLSIYPDGADCLHDFTYYSNADCTYYGTYPSIAHMLTGCELDTTIPFDEWGKNIWSNELTKSFYSELREHGYKANLYTTDANAVTSRAGCDVLNGKISNITNAPLKVSVNTPLLIKTITKMAGYRMAPDYLKQIFYTNVSEYSLIVQETENKILQTNGDFYAKLQKNGLTADKSSNYFIVQHLIGTHEFATDEYGNNKDGACMEETARGCMSILEEYLNQLKELNVYDNATIIVTADHGGIDKYDMQVIYYMKRPGENHEKSPVTNAPVSHCDLLATVAQSAGLDYSKYGTSVADLSQDEQRERTFWLRKYDPAYVSKGTTSKKENVYYKYTYTGDMLWLINAIDAGPSSIEKMYDYYY